MIFTILKIEMNPLYILTLCMLGNFACFFLSSVNFFTKKNLSGILLECQTVWIQIRQDILSGLIWVQTVCRGYQQMIKGATSRERDNTNLHCTLHLSVFGFC